MHLTDDQLRDIAIDAARSLFPPERIGDVSGSVGVAFNGEEAYHFVVHLDQVDDREEAADLRIDLRIAIRDRLLAKGDERYPYTRILSRDAVVDPMERTEMLALMIAGARS